ncbi:MAG: type IV secretory system conjugative DNA transfer family protein [Acidimicrobiales bacterium]
MDDPLAIVRSAAREAGGGLYLGQGAGGLCWAPPEQSVLVLGPPRSGKTSSLVVQALITAPGAAVSTSTKPDVLAITARARGRLGPCWLYDPSGTVVAPPGVEILRWSPITSCETWDGARLTSETMVAAGKPSAGRPGGSVSGSGIDDHWSERAWVVLATLFHAAALSGAPMSSVVSWVDRHEASPAMDILETNQARIAYDELAGIAVTDQREQSGIWSTASGILAAYHSETILGSTEGARFDARAFCDSSGTLYICAPGRHQEMLRPLVVGLLTEIQDATYARAAEVDLSGMARPGAPAGPGTQPPVLFALDELANIAPLARLPAMASEGGSQGISLLACLQDFSQARVRWGAAAEGFLSTFGTIVVLPGIGDVRTLEAISLLAGDEEIPIRSVTIEGRARGLGILGRRWPPGGFRRQMATGAGRPSYTVATTLRRRLPVDAISRGQQRTAIVLDATTRAWRLELTPWYAGEPWRSAVLGPPS